VSSDNLTGADNQQERLDALTGTRILRGHMPNTGVKPVKIWSDLHGDMQSQAEQEMTWPTARHSVGRSVTTVSVPIRCSRRKPEEGCP
jgi:hypothetical protein